MNSQPDSADDQIARLVALFRERASRGEGIAADELQVAIEALSRANAINGPPPATVSLQPGHELTVSLRLQTPDPSSPSPEIAPTLDGAPRAIPGGTLPAGWQFGDYEIVRKIAQGGMGVVYEARQRSLQRTVALKMIRAADLADNEEIARFYAEAEAAAGLRHPHIVAVYEVGRWGDAGHYFTMDYIAGPSLATVLQQQTLAPQRVAALLVKVSRAIHFAHERGVLHRDLKPSNILLGEEDEPRVADFGLAKRLQSDSGHTIDGTVLGTPSYMPPEQARGEQRALCPASDVYSLGAVLYECLTGRPPFVASNLADLLRQVVHDEPVPPSRLVPRLPRDLETICLKCLEKEPAKRYSTAAGLADDLERYQRDEPILARPVGPVERARKFARRKPAWAALAAAIIGAIVTVLTISVVYSRSLAAKNSQLTSTVGQLNKALEDVTTQSKLAMDRYESLRQNSYCTQIKQAENYYLADPPNLARAEELLQTLKPQAGDSDLRGLEWHHLSRLVEQHNVRLKIGERILSLATYADGSLLAFHTSTHSKAQNLSQWPPNGPLSRYQLHQSSAAVGEAFFSRDSEWFLSITSSGAIHLRSLKTPETIVSEVVGENEIAIDGYQTHADISADGSLVAWTRGDGVVHLWDVAEKKEQRTIATNIDSPKVVRISPNNRWIAMVSLRETVMLDVDNNRRIKRKPTVGATSYLTVAFAPDSETLAVSFSSADLELIPLQVGGKVRGFTLGKFGLHPSSLTYLGDGQRIVIGSMNGLVGVLDHKQNRVVVFRGHRGWVSAVAAGREPHQFFSSSSQGEVLEWDARVEDQRAKVIRPLFPEDNRASFTSLAYSPDGRYLACGGKRYSLPGDPKAGCLFLYDTTDFSRRRWETPDSVELCSFSADGNNLLWRERNETHKPTIRQRPFVWQDEQIEPAATDIATEAAAFVAGGELVVGNDEGLRLATEPNKNWQTQTKRTKALRIRDLFANSTGEILGDLELDFHLRIWNVREQREIVWSTGHITSRVLAISADGRYAAWKAPDPSFRGMSPEKAGWPQPSPETEPPEWAPHHRAVVFDLVKKQIKFIVGGHAEEIRALALSANGNRLLSGDGSGVLKLWDTETGNELLSFDATSMGVTAVAIHPQNKQFASLCSDGDVKIWHCE